MPELPEVETARRVIADAALGRPIVGVDADTFVSRPHSPAEMRAALTGRMLTAAHRRGKAIWCATSGAGCSFVPGPDLGIHLGMAGRIIVTSARGQAAEGGDPPGRDAQPRKPEWSRLTLRFADGGSLVLFDKRRLSRVRLDPPIEALGPDAQHATPAEFGRLRGPEQPELRRRAGILDHRGLGHRPLHAGDGRWRERLRPHPSPVVTPALLPCAANGPRREAGRKAAWR